METMFQYIDETAEQCLNNIHNSRELTAVITDSFLRKEYKRIVAVASGLCIINHKPKEKAR